MPKQGRLYLPSFLFNGTLLVLLLLVEIACGTTGNMSPLPATSTLINRAQHAIQHVKSHHFQLTTEHPGSGASNSILVTKANGDIVLKAPASAPPSSPAYNTLYFRHITEAAHTIYSSIFLAAGILCALACLPALLLEGKRSRIGKEQHTDDTNLDTHIYTDQPHLQESEASNSYGQRKK